LPAVLQALIVFAAEEAEETSKAAFYIAGGVLAAFAVLVSILGITRIGSFPASQGQARGVMALGALLVAATMAAAVLTG
jgi:hypothetical protein